ncbi:MAG: hypothetical protein COY70_04570 [Candidatus Magasanikbacteria bacterium CG_4_10_14_0_8_um_filter_42_12]|nr:MAG: hypothetical protein COY70_04570 [Candidatus Magasanikbacteria bacterium CG_4_10_14_0_8_um_filter_42_12]
MKTLVIKLFIFFVLVYTTISLFSLFAREELDPDNYLATTIDKHARLNSMESPKIIFVGDSSLAFGLDAKTIEGALQRPTSNMGLHAALGLEFTFKEIGDTINKNDVVFLSFHYYPNDMDINQGVICHTLDFYPRLKQRIVTNPLDGLRLDLICKIKRIRRYIVNRRASLVPNEGESLVVEGSLEVFSYARSSFTEYGDVRDSLYKTSEINFEGASQDMNIVSQWKTIREIQVFSKHVQSHGASIYFVFPPYPKSKYEYNSEFIEKFADMLRKNTDMNILGSPMSFTFSDDSFFNSDYHLTSFGKKEYTKRIIGLLKSSFEAQVR